MVYDGICFADDGEISSCRVTVVARGIANGYFIGSTRSTASAVSAPDTCVTAVKNDVICCCEGDGVRRLRLLLALADVEGELRLFGVR